ncbi:hypothetical protein AB834_02600 [PVC group bacterium (ex Bugula neritina AB1)]|nr:hypothetical protein AB834_02600 [PVC group bacterium (ex Bugula neritina AB1)]
MSIHDGIEKREFFRVPYESEIEIKIFRQNQLDKLPPGSSKNISACGLLLETDVSFPVGKILVLKLDLPTLSNLIEFDKSVIQSQNHLLGRTVRIEEYIADKKFGLGICFLKRYELTDDKNSDIISILNCLESHIE